MKPWHLRYARVVIYAGAAVAAVAVWVACWSDTPGDVGRTLVGARQLYGLWALALLLASLILGPLTAALPWLPFKPSLLYARRAVGVSAMLFAALHVACYLVSVGRRSWRELYTPGVLWVVGLVLGLVALADLLALGFTSRDAAVKSMGGRAWKRLHRTAYAAVAVVLGHALCLGADFGIGKAPDVIAPPDAGAGVGFAGLAAAWLVLFILRHKGIRLARRPAVPRPGP